MKILDVTFLLFFHTEHRVQQQAVAGSDIWGELGVVELWQGSLLVSLDQDLADADTAADITKTLLHWLHKVERNQRNDKYLFMMDPLVNIAIDKAAYLIHQRA